MVKYVHIPNLIKIGPHVCAAQRQTVSKNNVYNFCI